MYGSLLNVLLELIYDMNCDLKFNFMVRLIYNIMSIYNNFMVTYKKKKRYIIVFYSFIFICIYYLINYFYLIYLLLLIKKSI